MNRAYNYYVNQVGANMNFIGDGNSPTFKFKVSADLLNENFGGNIPDQAVVTVQDDGTGLGMAAIAEIEVVGSDLECTVTFNNNIPLNTIANGPQLQAAVTFLYASL